LKLFISVSELFELTCLENVESTQIDELWDNPNYEIIPPILDAGVVQFLDGSLRIGQISRILTSLQAEINSVASEQRL
jgi:hypothetical protein